MVPVAQGFRAPLCGSGGREFNSRQAPIMIYKINKSITPQQVGISGEYFVAGELTRRGFIASITLRNSEGIDIICTTPDSARQISIQVKTSKINKPSWILNKKSENKHSKNFFYIFVIIPNITSKPEYYIVPSKNVSDFISKSHKNWLSGKKKNGGFRKDTNMRVFKDGENNFKDRWDLLI